MATHSRILTWRIPRTEKPGGLQSMGSQRVRHDWATNTLTPLCPPITDWVSKKPDFSSKKPCPENMPLWEEIERSPNRKVWIWQIQQKSVREFIQGWVNHAEQSNSKYTWHPDYVPGGVLNARTHGLWHSHSLAVLRWVLPPASLHPPEPPRYSLPSKQEGRALALPQWGWERRSPPLVQLSEPRGPASLLGRSWPMTLSFLQTGRPTWRSVIDISLTAQQTLARIRSKEKSGQVEDTRKTEP